ncbi:MAG: diguanylate cyclase domain-containing protein [Acidimicrobiales bacterium]
MTKFESRSLPEFELVEPPVLESGPDLDVAGPSPLARASPGRATPGSSGPGPGTRGGTTPGGEPRFHSLGEHESDVVAVLDQRGRFLFVSASAERLFGYEIDDVVGQDAFALFDSSSVDHVRSLFDDLVARRRLSVSLEMSTVRSDGQPVDLDVVAANHLHDPIGGVVVNLRDVSGSRRFEQRLRDVHQRQATIIESLTDGVMIVDAAGRIVRVNEAFEVMFESPRVRLLGRRLGDLMSGSRALGLELVDAEGRELDFHNHPIAVSLRGGRRSVGVIVGLRRPGRTPTWVRANAQAMVDQDGTVTGTVASFSDVTVARQAAAELHREEQFLEVLLDTLDEGIVACDAEGRITVFNPSARRLHGLSEDSDPIGQIPTDQGLRHADGSPIVAREHPLIRAMSGDQVREVEIVLESAAGERRKVSVNGQALVDDEGWMLGAVVAMHDVTEQKRNEERLAELALHDPLTGLANRTLLAERLQDAIDRMGGSAMRTDRNGDGGPTGAGDQPGVAVFLLDLDEFKEINDGLGHDVGDDMLVAVAGRLTATVRPSDTVARLGGDEFVVVCDIESGEDEMLRITDRISQALAKPYRVDGRTLGVPASVGGVFVDNPDTDPSKLLSRADDAMYGVKWARRRQRRSAPD